MSVKIVLEKKHSDGTIERFTPYTYSCGNYMCGNSTNSDEKMIPKADLQSLGVWIESRLNSGLSGGVRMESELTGKRGLRTIKKIEVT